ncbi:MAG TPA: hypothetical protein VHE35_00615 [Kofleriaceae bacterium]|nr:hypothetical protein [Kofleriaceae bacterium]
MPVPLTPELLAERLDAVEAGDAAAAAALFADEGAAAVARKGGPALAFRFLVAELGHVLGHVEAYADDAARERYSALLDEFGRDADRLAILRALGARLHQLERDGTLPRSMVVRTRRRDDRSP